MQKGYTGPNLFLRELGSMSSHHRLEKKLSQEVADVDVKGIAVAIAFLVGVGVFTGDRDNRSVSQDREAASVSMETAPAVTTEKTRTLQQPDGDSARSDTSRGLTVFR